MSALSDRIAAEHWITLHEGWHCVGCGYSDLQRGEDYTSAGRRHLAEVTERAVRAAIVLRLARTGDRHTAEASRHTADSREAVNLRGVRSHAETALAYRNKASATYDAVRIAAGETDG